MTKLFKRVSGIHSEAFYNKHFIPDFHIEEHIDDFMVSEKAIEEELADLDIDDYSDETEMYDCARRNVEEACLMYNYAYEPVTFDEDIALICHLIPFTYFDIIGNKYEILSFGGAGMDMTYKLEAYQLLVDRSYDEHSNFAKSGIGYFENYFGNNSTIINRIKELIKED